MADSTHRNTSARRRSPRTRKTAGPRASRSGKVRKAFWLDPQLLEDARASLGASTERETVEIALDLVSFRKELERGTRGLLGIKLSRID